MSEPIREQALAAIVTILRGMTGQRPGADGIAWGQYPNDPVVERGYRDEGLVNQFPSVFVARRPGSAVTVETTVGGAVGVDHSLLVDIYGYTQNAGDVVASTWLERLWDDVYTTLMKNATLLGTAKDVNFDAEDDYDEDGVKAGFRMGLTVLLYESKAIE